MNTPEEKAKVTITQEDDGRISIQGDEEEVIKISIFIAEMFLKEDELTEGQLETIVDIAENIWATNFRPNSVKVLPEQLEKAKKFLEAVVEKYSYSHEQKYPHQRALNVLAWIQRNPLISESISWRAALVANDPPTVELFQEEYKNQAAYWRKRIAEAEGRTFEGDAPSLEEVLDSERLRFFKIYKQAFDGDLEAMKICFEFCENEADYWNKH